MQLDTFAPARDTLEELERAWEQSDALFGLLDEAWLERPIPLRHPFLFYLGHLPAFTWNQIGRGALGEAPLDGEFEELFERGIDPPTGRAESHVRADAAPPEDWPDVESVLAYRDRVRDAVRRVHPRIDALARDPLLDKNRVVQLAVEHEQMHHETLLYMLQRLSHDRKRRPAGLAAPELAADVPDETWIAIPPGRVTLGADFEEQEFGWDNEFPALQLQVDGFEVRQLPVTVGEYLRFVEAGGYEEPRVWTPEGAAWLARTGRRHPLGWSFSDSAGAHSGRTGRTRAHSGRSGRTRAHSGRSCRTRAHSGRSGWRLGTLFEDLPLEAVLSWPVLVTQVEAEAYARWSGARLPTEAELQRAAYGTPDGEERLYPWGSEPPQPEHGNFGLRRLDPAPVGRSPAGASAFGVLELVGNGWEWTSTPFAPLPGFEPWMATYPGYSTDFFGGEHNVVFGGSWATHPRLLRRSFRNWYQRAYPYAASTFRTVRP